MNTFGWGGTNDSYVGRDFAISSSTNSDFVNLQIQGVHETLDTSQDHQYPNGVWVSMHDSDIDELITALQYWQKYKTFNKESD